MMDGIPASNSIADAMGVRSQAGATSVRNSAMPKLTGTASSIAIKAVTTVPTIGTSAPNRWFTASQSVETRNFQPKVANASRPPHAMDSAMPSSAAATSSAQPPTNTRKTRSPAASERRRSRFKRAEAALIARSLRELRLPVRLDPLHQRIRQRHVIQRLRLWLTVLQRPFEEVERNLAARGVLRMLVEDHPGGGG